MVIGVIFPLCLYQGLVCPLRGSSVFGYLFVIHIVVFLYEVDADAEVDKG